MLHRRYQEVVLHNGESIIGFNELGDLWGPGVR